ncbi:hypothetical protein DER44DRAFT_767193 [Fusarium oxysporum]|nr:hypothetical protein DER44DRAFT_767193 [Fusarium oxysporum]
MVKAMFTLCLNPATSSFAEMTDRQGGNLKLPSINTSWWLPAPPRSVFLQRNRCPLGPVSNNPSTGTVHTVLGEEGSSSLWARGNVEGPSRWTGPPSRPLERRTKAGLLECLQASRELKSPGLLLISTWASWATISTGSVRPSTEPKQKPQPEKTVSTATPTYTNQRL